MKLTIAQQQLSFLERTAAFYNFKNRSIKRDRDGHIMSCTYYPANKNTPGCAIGKDLDPKLAKQCGNLGLNKVFHMLPEKLKVLGSDFLALVQVFHDTDENWNKNGISEEGFRQVNRLKNLFKLKDIILPTLQVDEKGNLIEEIETIELQEA